MTDRHNTHNGRDLDGNFRVRQADVDDVLEDPTGVDKIRDDVRLGGAVADTGPQAGLHAQHVGQREDAAGGRPGEGGDDGAVVSEFHGRASCSTVTATGL